MKGNSLPLHASHNGGDALPASPHPLEFFTKEQLEEITRLMRKNAVEMADIRLKMQKMYDLFFNSLTAAPVSSIEYQAAIRDARKGNTKPLKEFLIKTNGRIPDGDRRGQHEKV